MAPQISVSEKTGYDTFQKSDVAVRKRNRALYGAIAALCVVGSVVVVMYAASPAAHVENEALVENVEEVAEVAAVSSLAGCYQSNGNYCYSEGNTCPDGAMSQVGSKEECLDALTALGLNPDYIRDYNNANYPAGCFAHGSTGNAPYFNIQGNVHSNSAGHTKVMCKRPCSGTVLADGTFCTNAGIKPAARFTMFEAGYMSNPGSAESSMVNGVNNAINSNLNCRRENFDFSSFSNGGTCGTGGSSNIGFKFTAIFYAHQAGTWGFDFNVDFGWGGGVRFDGVASSDGFHGPDIWWGNNWNNAMTVDLSQHLEVGWHIMEAYGGEGCCDGGSNIKFYYPGSSWMYLTEGNLPSMCTPKTYANSNYASTAVTGISGSSVYVTCNTGYYNTGYVTCQNGQFTDRTCHALWCNQKTYSNSGTVANGMYGQSVTVSCNAGYSTGSATSTCQSNQYFTDVTCAANACSGKTYANSNYASTAVSGTTGQQTYVSCNAGYYNTGYVTCQTNGQFTDRTCHANSCNQKTYSNSGTVANGVTGNSVTVSCNTGYSTNSATSTCQTNGYFTDVTCAANACSGKTYANSNYASTAVSGTTGSATWVTCNAGYSGSNNVYCQTNGQFQDLTCSANSCTSSQVSNSDKSASGSITGVTGDVVTVTCDAGYGGSTCDQASAFSITFGGSNLAIDTSKTMSDGNRMWHDRAGYHWQNTPSEMDGALMISYNAGHDQWSTQDITITTTESATLYVMTCHNADWNSASSQGFTYQSAYTNTYWYDPNPTPYPVKIYKKEVSAGTYTIPGQSGTSMTIAAKCAGSSSSSSGSGAVTTTCQTSGTFTAAACSGNACPSTQVPFSNYATTGSIAGVTSDSVSVVCNDGYSGGGTATCNGGSSSSEAVSSVTCSFSADNYVVSFYLDGEEVSSTVSGNMNSWPTPKTISFNSDVEDMSIYAYDAEWGCSNGGFGMVCTSNSEKWTFTTSEKAGWSVFSSQSASSSPPDDSSGLGWSHPDYQTNSDWAAPQWSPASIWFSSAGVVGAGKSFCSGVGHSTQNMHWWYKFRPNMDSVGENWHLVFRQTSGFYQAKSEWENYNEGNPSASQYSILDKWGDFVGSDGKYHLKMTWPDDTSDYMEWKQTSNPFEKTEGYVDGYEGIHIPWTAYGWGGLEYGSSSGLLDGSSTSPRGWWYYAVGTTGAWNSGVPAYSGSAIGNGDRIELYMYSETYGAGGDGTFNQLECIAQPCASTQVANSNYPGTDSISGVTGDTVSVTCNTGYSPGGDVSCGASQTCTVTCEGTGQFTAMTCDSNWCTATEVPDSNYATVDTITGYTGQTVSVTCDEGYFGSGAATCLATGSFSVPECHGYAFLGCYSEDQIPGWPQWSCDEGSDTYYATCGRLSGSHAQIAAQCGSICKDRGATYFDIHDTTACFCGAATNTATSGPLHDEVWTSVVVDGPDTGFNLGDGLGAYSGMYQNGHTVRLSWGSDYIEFKPESNIFSNRAGNNNGYMGDNQIVQLDDFKTSDATLQGWVDDAGGAIFCMGNAGAWDTAWAILPQNNNYWGIGCNSGGWNGRGAYYGEPHYGSGWVGVKNNGQAKAGASIRTELHISLGDPHSIPSSCKNYQYALDHSVAPCASTEVEYSTHNAANSIFGTTGETADVACHRGYSGSGTAVCAATGSFTSITCTANSCAPTQVANSNKKDTGSITGTTTQTVGVTCDLGYTGSGIVTCTNDGVFSPLHCNAIPCTPTEVPHSDHSSTDSIYGSTSHVVQVTCDAGYSGSGPSTCQAHNAQFTQVTCTPNPCTDVNVANSNYKSAPISGVMDQTRSVVCDPGYSGDQTVWCRASGSWDTAFCNPNLCNAYDVANSNKAVSDSITGRTTDTVAVQCDEGYSVDGNIGTRDATTTCMPPAPEGEEANPSESSRTYSSIWGNNAIGTGHARSMLDSPQAWSAQHNSVGQWMQIDVGAATMVAGVVVQGRSVNYQYVTKYTVQTSTDGATFANVEGFEGSGSNDHDREESLFPAPVQARYVRIVAQEWSGHLSMRAGLVLSGGNADGTGDFTPVTCPPNPCADVNVPFSDYVSDPLSGVTTDVITVTCDAGYTPDAGGEWTLLIRQTTPHYVPQASWIAGINTNDPENNNYSILGELDDTYRDATGKFHFKLKWPANGLNDQEWKQTNNPVTSPTRGVTGYEAVDVQYTSQGWGGLERNTGSQSVMDGTLSPPGNWFYAVGSTGQWSSGIPGPNGAVSVVELYVKGGAGVNGGTKDSTCQTDGTFSSVTCSAIPCADYEVAHSDKSDAASITGVTTDEITVTCDPGYSPEGEDGPNGGSKVTTCQTNEIFSSVTCTPKPCADTSVEFSDYREDGSISGVMDESRSITCDPGYSTDAPAFTTRYATTDCEANEQWSEVTCSPNPCLAYSVPNSDYKEENSITGVTTDVVRVECDVGYSTVGEWGSPQGKALTCNPNGQFDTMECLPNPCEAISVAHSDKVSQQITGRTTDTTAVACDVGYSITPADGVTECLVNGTFSYISCKPTSSLDIYVIGLEDKPVTTGVNEDGSPIWQFGSTPVNVDYWAPPLVTEGVSSYKTVNFQITKNTLAFTTSGGSNVVGASEISLVSDFKGQWFNGVGGQKRKSHSPNSEGQYEVTWDVTPLLGHTAAITIADNSLESDISFDNLRMFDGAQGCLPECLVIEAVECNWNALGDTCFMFNGQISSPYVPTQAAADVVGPAQYCRYSPAPFGEASSVGLLEGWGENSTIQTDYLEVTPNLPECIYIEPTGPKEFGLAVDLDRVKFQFSADDESTPVTYNENDRAHMYCIYDTSKPRCADYSGVLRSRTQHRHACAEVDPEMSCLEIIYDAKCVAGGAACGKKKATRDIMKCCSKSYNDPGAGCLKRRRRLNEAMDMQIITNVEGAESCAEACFRRSMGPGTSEDSCVAWRLNEAGECKLATTCYYPEMADQMLVGKELWNTIQGVDVFGGKAKPAPTKVKKWRSPN